jgi:hypothetical protein
VWPPGAEDVEVLTVFVFAAAACQPPASLELVGFWESRKTSKGGIGHTLEFRADGVTLASQTAIVNMSYRVFGDRLLVEESGSANSQAAGVPFQIHDGSLIQTGPDGAILRKERMDKRGPLGSPIVGTWRYRHYTGSIAYERYLPDGHLMFRLPLSADVGCYSLAGAQLSMTGPNSATMPFEINGETLILKQEGKVPSHMIASPVGPGIRWSHR